MKVGEVMRRRFGAVGPRTSVLEAVSTMTGTREEALPVVDGGRLVGMVAERDVLRRVFDELSSDVYVLGLRSMDPADVDAFRRVAARTVGEIMETRVITVDPDTPALRAAGIMRANRIRRLPVVAEGRLLGVIFQRDILDELLRQAGEGTAHPAPSILPGADPNSRTQPLE